MTFKQLTLDDKNLFAKLYSPDYRENKKELSRDEVQDKLSEYFDVSKRSVREWANKMGLGLMAKNIVNPTKILIYDIETSRVEAKLFWTGKTYINYKQIRGVPQIISVSWRWLGEEKVSHLKWDMKTHTDEQLVTEFLKVYNKADMVVGYNNKNFDDRWINAKAMKYNLFVNVYVKSFDLIKHSKRLFRLISYSMAYLAEFMGVTLKQGHEGILMWDMIEDGTKEQQEEYIQKMINYNVGDIITTEEIFLKLRKYMGHTIHVGAFEGGEKYSCPHCGGINVELFKATNTAAGTPQYIMRCLDDDVQYKISHRDYMKFLQSKVDKFNLNE
tara:strand:+ start:1772 stop:2758 length:987 start_codon:yes stop_codon:yes gene_type:complete